ncbi:ribose-phosphate pyrophosphokinase [Sphingomonas sp.]|uniref:ribose-phosphate pyrophosphokinase n=1 Tax=Sphingomonas sp. TaxID=28214 RepID=UPI0035C7C131
MRAASRNDGDLSAWLEAEGIVPVEGPGTIADVALVRGLLVSAARDGRAVSYSELLRALDHRFTRPKMRALCKTLDAIDAAGEAAGEPALAVLVVREGDRLPGQGWWTTLGDRRGYRGAWEGREAERFVAGEQEKAFAYWRVR